MKIKRIKFQNYTVFEDQQMEFSPGINVIIGENGTGKTHLMKALYSACQSADKKTSFSHKLVMTMLPDDYKISRLITRKTGNRTAVIRIAAKESETDRDRILSASFHGKTKKWDAEVTGEDGWENSFAGIPECTEVVEDKALIFKKSDVSDLWEKLQDASQISWIFS